MIERTRQAIQGTGLPDSIPYVGAAAVGAIVQHYLAIVDVIALLVALLWCVDMLGGTARAMLRGAQKGGRTGALKAWSWPKAAEGIGKLVAVVLAVIVFGAFEIAQTQATEGGGYIPLVGPALFAALAGFGLSILDQIHDLWAAYGARVREILDKRAGKK